MRITKGETEKREKLHLNFRKHFFQLKLFSNIYQLIIILYLLFALYINANTIELDEIYIYIISCARIEEQNISYKRARTIYPSEIIEKMIEINIVLNETKYTNYIYKAPHLDDYIEGKNINETSDFIESVTVKGTYGIFHDVFANGFSTFGSPTKYVVPKSKESWFARHRFLKMDGVLKYYFDEIVLMGNQHTREKYGHFHHDVLFPMMLIPEEVRRRSYVMGFQNNTFAHDALEAIGFDRSMIIDIDEDDWMYCKRLHTIVKPAPFLFYFGICGQRLHKVFSEYFHLDKVKSSLYAFCNRGEGEWRHLSNMNDLIEKAKIEIPNIKWVVLPDRFASLKETALNWAAIKLVFLPTGSNCVKCVHMKPYSVIIVALADIVDLAALRTATCCEIFNMWFSVPNMTHFGEKNATNLMNISFALQCLKCGVYCSIYQKWPNSFYNLS